MKWRRVKGKGGKGVGDEKKSETEGGRRLFSTLSIMTLAWVHAQLLNDKYPGEPVHFVFFGWRATAVVKAEE